MYFQVKITLKNNCYCTLKHSKYFVKKLHMKSRQHTSNSLISFYQSGIALQKRENKMNSGVNSESIIIANQLYMHQLALI